MKKLTDTALGLSRRVAAIPGLQPPANRMEEIMVALGGRPLLPRPDGGEVADAIGQDGPARQLVGLWPVITYELEWRGGMDAGAGLTALTRQWEGCWWEQLVHPDDHGHIEQALEIALTIPGAQFLAEYRLRCGDGRHANVWDHGFIIRDDRGMPVRLVGSIMDLSRMEMVEEARQRTQALVQAIADGSPNCVKLLDLDGNLLFLSSRGALALELGEAEPPYGKPWIDFWPDDVQPTVAKAIEDARQGRHARFSAFCPTFRGSARWWDVVVAPVMDDGGQPVRLLSISRDVTEAHLANERLRWQAMHDALTGLPNRANLDSRLSQALADAAAAGDEGRVGLLHLDLDNFKQVNDTLGHSAGDKLLKIVAQRLTAIVAPPHFVARYGGDEFVFVIPRIASAAALEDFANEILDVLADPVVIEGRLIVCRGSIGGVITPDHGVDAEILFKRADIALYVAKEAGRGRFRLYQEEMRDSLRQKVAMLEEARSALAEDRILPFYQPKVDLATGRVVGFEALLRIATEAGPRDAGCIAAAFDDYWIASDLGDRMRTQVIADMRSWLARGLPFGHVAINVSTPELLRPRFDEMLLQALMDAGVPPGRLQIEVTETVILDDNAEQIVRTLRRLRRVGMEIAFDDFGTGYASLRHLRNFPLDILKVDRSFVRDMNSCKEDRAVLHAVVELGRSLDLSVVAEGVEHRWQATSLRRMGCTMAQGFLYSPAVPAADVAAMLMVGVAAQD